MDVAVEPTQGTLVAEERASLVFLQAVRRLLASGRAVLHDLEGGTPDVPANQVLIGGVDRTGTYLMTPTTYDLVCEYKRRAWQGVPGVSEHSCTCWSRMDCSSVSIGMGATRRCSGQSTTSGVLHLPADVLCGASEFYTLLAEHTGWMWHRNSTHKTSVV